MPSIEPRNRPVSAHDAARRLRVLVPAAGTLKIHKLLYYAQGWHLVWYGAPMFRERVEAWTKGPVVAELWRDERHGRSFPEPQALTPEHMETVRYVVGRYGHLTATELVRLTHTEDPWRHASEQDEPWTEASPEISHTALRNWFENDDWFTDHKTEVDRLRKHRANSFGPLERTPDLDAAITAALTEPPTRDPRPALG